MRKTLIAIFALMIICMSIFGITQISDDSIKLEEKTEQGPLKTIHF